MSDHDRLAEGLRRRADQLDDASPLTLDDVRGRARSIRRRRTAVSGLAAAAVLAVAVPIGMAVDDRVTSRPDEGPVAGPDTASPRPDDAGPRELLLTTDVETSSGAPEIPYVLDGALRFPDGGEVPLGAEYTTVAAFGEGWAAVRRDDEGEAFLDLLDEDGSVTGSRPTTGALAVSPDGTVLAWATPGGELLAGGPDEDPVSMLTLPGEAVQPVGVVGSGSCAADSEGGGCAVYFDTEGAEPTGRWVTSKGITGQVDGLRSVAGVSPDGLVAGSVSATDTGSCSALLDAGREPAWETCEHSLGRFSLDGRHLVGRPAYLDGIGDASVAILDAATGDVLVEATNDAQTQSFVADSAWDTDGTLLLTVWQDGWSLMRLSPEGTLSTVLPDLGDDMDAVPLRFAARP
jgi:hypothetical protein